MNAAWLNGYLKPAADLEALFKANGVPAKPKVIAYCGGGISATIGAD
ncbi:MAG: 3-mercaptopyruvate sulfurtransferase SseA [Granulosicoccus sp.]